MPPLNCQRCKIKQTQHHHITDCMVAAAVVGQLPCIKYKKNAEKGKKYSFLLFISLHKHTISRNHFTVRVIWHGLVLSVSLSNSQIFLLMCHYREKLITKDAEQNNSSCFDRPSYITAPTCILMWVQQHNSHLFSTSPSEYTANSTLLVEVKVSLGNVGDCWLQWEWSCQVDVKCVHKENEHTLSKINELLQDYKIPYRSAGWIKTINLPRVTTFMINQLVFKCSLKKWNILITMCVLRMTLLKLLKQLATVGQPCS